jgi:hypothetical protein
MTDHPDWRELSTRFYDPTTIYNDSDEDDVDDRTAFWLRWGARIKWLIDDLLWPAVGVGAVATVVAIFAYRWMEWLRGK